MAEPAVCTYDTVARAAVTKDAAATIKTRKNLGTPAVSKSVVESLFGLSVQCTLYTVQQRDV
jgi:hypothetical protein